MTTIKYALNDFVADMESMLQAQPDPPADFRHRFHLPA